MRPEKSLPLPPEFSDAEEYVSSLLDFGTSNTLLRTLCGGVHINDFFNRDPDLYQQVLPAEWRIWFKSVEIEEILDLLMRHDLDKFSRIEDERWKDFYVCIPPQSLIRYIRDVRKHLLDRNFQQPLNGRKIDRKIGVGMNVKKLHEVENFSRYVDLLTTNLNNATPGKESEILGKITHLVDFGAGQNYLGRALASQPYNRSIIAIESRPHVVQGAKKMDVLARVVERTVVMRNKKVFRAETEAGLLENLGGGGTEGLPTPNGTSDSLQANGNGVSNSNGEEDNASTSGEVQPNGDSIPATKASVATIRANLEIPKNGQGTIQYVEHRIKDGNLATVIDQIIEIPKSYSKPDTSFQAKDHSSPEAGLMVISLHSCGNLLHHGIRTLTLNPSVRAVALVGCCYNLMTERLGPPTFKLPFLRSHPRLEDTSDKSDPVGFPMSERFVRYRHRVLGSFEESQGCNGNGVCTGEEEQWESGIRLNITARMMAVQAPQNWNERDSASFFKRHFYRALLQRIFLEKGVIKPLSPIDKEGGAQSSTAFVDEGEPLTTPIIIGTLSKKCYATFTTYVRGVVTKVSAAGGHAGRLMDEKVAVLTDEEIFDYEERFAERKKELSVIWSLMAFSAGVVEAMVVIDRWSFLKEQDCVADAWVEPVFDYGQSPRNLVVVGIKK